jgi:hypothetical protein
LHHCRTQIKEKLEDVFFGECTVNFPVELKLLTPLSATHDLLWIHTGPEFMGWPCKRTRMFCCGVNKETMRYVGPADYRAAFADRFYCMTQLSGDELFCSPELDVHKYYVDLARSQGFDMTIESVSSMPPKLLLPRLVSPGYVAIFEEHCQKMKTSQSVGGTYIGDLHQRPGTRSVLREDRERSGTDIPGNNKSLRKILGNAWVFSQPVRNFSGLLRPNGSVLI